MFLTEGATQFTAEILYNVSNGTNIRYREQPNTVRCHSEHTPYSPLSEYQLNGNIISLLSLSLQIPLNQILALGFKKNGRQELKEMYEAIPGNEGKIEEFMLDLEQIYSIDHMILQGYSRELSGDDVEYEMQNGRIVKGSIKKQGDLIDKVERQLVGIFLENNSTEYVLANCDKIFPFLTSYELKQNFINGITNISMLASNPEISENGKSK